MNQAEWLGERMLRDDPFWSPQAVPFADLNPDRPAWVGRVGLVIQAFPCGHPATGVNTINEQCRRCWNDRKSEINRRHRKRLKAEREARVPAVRGRGVMRALVSTVALGAMPADAKQLGRMANVSKETARSVLDELRMAGKLVSMSETGRGGPREVYSLAAGVAATMPSDFMDAVKKLSDRRLVVAPAGDNTGVSDE